MFLRGELVQEIDIFVRESVFVYERCGEDFLYLFFSLLFRYICSYIVIANLVLMLIYIFRLLL